VHPDKLCVIDKLPFGPDLRWSAQMVTYILILLEYDLLLIFNINILFRDTLKEIWSHCPLIFYTRLKRSPDI